MPRSIVVPVDASAESERALRVAAHLAPAGQLPVEVLTVAPPDADPAAVEDDLGAAVRSVAPALAAGTWLPGTDVVGALVDALAERPDSLVVLGTSARGPLSELLLGSISEAVLARSDHPLLLVGPHVADRPLGPSLVAAVADRSGELLLPAVAEWSRTFGSDPWVVQVNAPRRDTRWPLRPSTESGLVLRLAESLRHEHLDAQWDVLHGRNTPDALVEFTTTMGGGVIAVASERWADPGRIRWTSTARALVHRSPYPVLVVPLHQALVVA